MAKEIYISTTPHETRLAIVEDEQLAEIYYERENEYTLAGSIYNGKVTRVLPGMQSSFVDVGLERDAFLYVTDFMEEQGDAADFESDGSAGRRPPVAVPREAAPLGAAASEAPREGMREEPRRGRGDRERGGRDRGGDRGGRDRERGGSAGREAVRPAAAESGETVMFDEPIAPKPVEAFGVVEPGNGEVLDEQGSRRWRGRRGRRRGRGGREGGAEVNPAVAGAEMHEPQEVEAPERLSLEGSAAADVTGIVIDVEAETRVPEGFGSQSEAGLNAGFGEASGSSAGSGSASGSASGTASGAGQFGRRGESRGGRGEGRGEAQRGSRERGRDGGRGERSGSGRRDEAVAPSPRAASDGTGGYKARIESPSRADADLRGSRSRAEYGSTSYGEESAPGPVGEAIVLPGESIRKYRDPAEVAAEDSARRASMPGGAEVIAVNAPSVEIVGWDGGATLPGESLSRRRGPVSSSAGLSRESRQESGSRDGGRERGGRDRDNRGRGGRERGGREPQTSSVSQEERGSGRESGQRESASLQPIDLQAYAVTAERAPENKPFAEVEERITPTPIPDVAAIAAAAVPEETGGLTQHPAHGDESAAVSPAVAGAEGSTAPTQATEAAEYEPGEGERATLGDAGRRDYRRVERQVEAEVPLASARIATETPEMQAPESLAAAPDATTYDLSGNDGREAEPGAHEFTTIASTGEMRDETPGLEAELREALPPVQDGGDPIAAEVAIQAGVLSVSRPEGDFDWVSSSVPAGDARESSEAVASGFAGMPASSGNSAEQGELLDEAESDALGEAMPQVHAFGDGDLEEEEVDGDEFEYDVAGSQVDEEEFEDYEEETLEGSGDREAVLEELSLDESEMDEEDAVPATFAEAVPDTGGFSVEDFGGEPVEVAGEPAERSRLSERRGGRDSGRDGARDGRRSSSRDRERRPGGGFRGGAGASASGDRGRGRGRQSVQTMDLPAINELLKPGQEILVQIAKEPIAMKGARITSHIALPGRFLVFMPTVNHTGVSRKISSEEERRRLRTILLSEKGEAQGGFIVRTAADGASEEELRNDLRFLIQLWQDIKARSESSKSPALIYHDLSLIERILRDQVTDNFSAIWVDSEAEYERVLRFLQRFQPSLVRRVKLYTKETPLFEHFGVTPEIDKALKSKVWLKSGGSIVIDQTEALVAIDINTGKYVGKTARLEDTILKTNLDAIPEIVRQIRLRDLGGIIVIDFIDMEDRRNRAKVMQVLEDELRSDRAPSKVLPFNDFGLVIMTRKRVKQSLERTLCIPDPVTEGTGMIKSPVTVANEIYVEMRKMQRHFEKTDVMLRVHPEVVKQLKASGGKRLLELEEMTRKTILVKSDSTLNPEQFDIH